MIKIDRFNLIKNQIKAMIKIHIKFSNNILKLITDNKNLIN